MSEGRRNGQLNDGQKYGFTLKEALDEGLLGEWAGCDGSVLLIRDLPVSLASICMGRTRCPPRGSPRLGPYRDRSRAQG